jgi:hypothetical protein
MEGSMQQALAENVRMLKAFIQNQLAQVCIVDFFGYKIFSNG